jgi:hypothetical protein
MTTRTTASDVRGRPFEPSDAEPGREPDGVAGLTGE